MDTCIQDQRVEVQIRLYIWVDGDYVRAVYHPVRRPLHTSLPAFRLCLPFQSCPRPLSLSFPALTRPSVSQVLKSVMFEIVYWAADGSCQRRLFYPRDVREKV